MPVPAREWDEPRKSALCARIVSGELTLDAACAENELTLSDVEDWLREFRRLALLEFDAELKGRLMSQGASAAAQSAAVFTGTLDDISVADMIQSIQIAGKDAVITISAEGVDSRIWCARGAVVDAESAPLAGEPALYRILALDHGQMLADLRAAPHQGRISAPTHRLLLEAARRKDEVARLLRELGDPNLRFQAARAAPAAELGAAEASLLGIFAEARSVREALARSELGDWETATALVSLVRRGHLQHAEGARAPEPVPVAARERPSALSFLPITVGEPPARPSVARGLWVALAALALVPVAFWLGEKASAAYPPSAPVHVTAAATKSSVAVACPPPPVSTPASFSVALRVEPAEAELWLDGQNVGRGSFERIFSRDGTKHELRALADGFVPAQIWFSDVAPPAELHLAPLPAAVAPPPAIGRGSAEPGDARAPGKRKPSARKASRVTTPAQRGVSDAANVPSASAAPVRAEASTSERLSRARAGETPRIQVIE